jgi:general L-amino acid transport system permease protein
MTQRPAVQPIRLSGMTAKGTTPDNGVADISGIVVGAALLVSLIGSVLLYRGDAPFAETPELIALPVSSILISSLVGGSVGYVLGKRRGRADAGFWFPTLFSMIGWVVLRVLGVDQLFLGTLGAIAGWVLVATVLPSRAYAGKSSGEVVSELRTAATPPVWRDANVLKIVAQVVALAAIATVLGWLVNNLFDSLRALNFSTSFKVLENPAQINIRDDPGFDPRSPIFPNMLWVGIKNTAISAVVGIAIAVILGTLIGIGRLSNNWLVQKLCTLYVETLRNIPPLVIITFFWFAVFTFGPFPVFNASSRPWEIKIPGTDDNFLILSNDRWAFPSFYKDGKVGTFWILMAFIVVAACCVWIWRTAVNIKTGAPHRRVLASLGTLLGLGAIAFLATSVPYRFSWPSVTENGRNVLGGFSTNNGYISLTIALGLYTASHVAEITRGSILAVSKGQTEAANALALSGFQRYRFVVLPQAAQIAIPPLINQFLNLTKNTSLATAVAYPEITSLIKTAIGNNTPPVQALAVLMFIYLLFSLFWSVLLNLTSRKFRAVGR